jgi:hypothetical protein
MTAIGAKRTFVFDFHSAVPVDSKGIFNPISQSSQRPPRGQRGEIFSASFAAPKPA